MEVAGQILKAVWMLKARAGKIIKFVGGAFSLFENTGSVTKDQMRINTWRIIPLSKWLVTPIYKPWSSAIWKGYKTTLP